MGYYIRVLGKKLATPTVQEMREVALPAVVDVAEGSADTWEQLTLRHKSGQEIAIVERNPVEEGKLGADELQEFLDEVPLHKPSDQIKDREDRDKNYDDNSNDLQNSPHGLEE
jgi:hypothetical protein